MKERIGFCGLGIMGRGMAKNLLAAGFPLTVWNRTSERADDAVAGGGERGEDPAAVAAASDVVICCVSDTDAVEEVCFGDRGVCNVGGAGKLLIDCSTIAPEATRGFAVRASEKGWDYLDAPISGGSEGAEKGTLSIMVGGSREGFARAEACFEAMGKNWTHVGEVGAGQTVKLFNQILVVGHALAMAEAFEFAAAGGIDGAKALEAVEHGAAGSWMLSMRGPQILADDWRPGFMIDLQEKDLRLVLEAADQWGVALPSTAQIFQYYRSLIRLGLGREGNHALIKAVRLLNGQG